MLSTGFRRSRKPNYTRQETEILLDSLLNYGEFLFGKSVAPGTLKQRSNIWASIADLVNEIPHGAGRTVEELKHRWKDLVHRARGSLRKHSNDVEMMLQKEKPYMNKVLRIMGNVYPHFVPDQIVGLLSSLVPSSETIDLETLPGGSNSSGEKTTSSSNESPVTQNVSVNSPERTPPLWKTGSLKRFRRDSNDDNSPPGKQVPAIGDPEAEPVIHLSSNSNNDLDASESTEAFLTATLGYTVSSSSFGRSTRNNKNKSRPMVMDPESEMVVEIISNDGANKADNFSSEGDPTTEEMLDDPDYHSDLPFIENNDCGSGKKTPNDSRSRCATNNHKRKSDKNSLTNDYDISRSNAISIQPHTCSSLDDRPLEDMSKEELERLHLIRQIRFYDQRRSYIRLKEEKLLLEIEMLKNGAGSSAS